MGGFECDECRHITTKHTYPSTIIPHQASTNFVYGLE
jgi:hypothetical protein